MGLIQSRRSNGSPESDQTSSNIYKYPPKTGNYFGSHFYMGGEKFDAMRPDAFLFGENEDLNFLANKLFSYSFSAPQTNEPIKTLKSLINIRKDSLKFVRVTDESLIGSCAVANNIATSQPAAPPPLITTTTSSSSPPSTKTTTSSPTKTTTSSSSSSSAAAPVALVTSMASNYNNYNNQTSTFISIAAPDIITSSSTVTSPQQQQQQQTTTTQTLYNIEFTFDSDVKCAITIYYFATEDFVDKQVVYKPRDPDMNSETFHYKRGSNQVFSQSTHIVDPSKFPDSQWQYDPVKETIPIVIQCDAEDEEHVGHSHILYAVVDKIVDGSYILRPLKQKQMMNGLCYLLQEIYGIENKNTESAKPDEDIDDNGSECIICMCEPRDTVILPCRHLCLCNVCADNLRYQANNCPICRAKFRALLQIRAIQKKKPASVAAATATAAAVNIIGQSGRGAGGGSRLQRDVGSGDTSSALSTNQDGVPPGYEAVSLVEALNGPTLPHRARQVTTNLHKDQTSQSIYVNIEGVVAGSSSCGAATSATAAVAAASCGTTSGGSGVKNQVPSKTEQQQLPSKAANKKAAATLALKTPAPEFMTSSTPSSSSSTSRNTISPSLSTVGEKFDADDDDDFEDGVDSHHMKSNQDDVTSSSAHVGTGGDGSSFQQASIRSSVANTSMDSETAGDIKFIDSQSEECSAAANQLRTSLASSHPLSSGSNQHVDSDLNTP